MRETFPIYVVRQDDEPCSTSATSWGALATRPTSVGCLSLTYGAPFRIRVRLEKPDPVEEWVYLGEIPIMVGGVASS